MGLLSRQAILDADDIKYDIVNIPEWGGDVRVKSCSSKARDEYEESLVRTTITANGTAQQVSDFANAKARLVVKCCVDTNGARMFTDADAEVLGKKCAGPVNQLYQKIQSLSGMGKKAMDDLEKNSDAGQTASLPSV